jgi:hypothetical protein
MTRRKRPPLVPPGHPCFRHVDENRRDIEKGKAAPLCEKRIREFMSAIWHAEASKKEVPEPPEYFELGPSVRFPKEKWAYTASYYRR